MGFLGPTVQMEKGRGNGPQSQDLEMQVSEISISPEPAPPMVFLSTVNDNSVLPAVQPHPPQHQTSCSSSLNYYRRLSTGPASTAALVQSIPHHSQGELPSSPLSKPLLSCSTSSDYNLNVCIMYHLGFPRAFPEI